MRLEISFEFCSVSIELIETIINQFCSSEFKNIEVNQHLDILSVNPLNKTVSTTVKKSFNSLVEFKTYFESQKYVHRVVFNYKYEDDCFEVLEKSRISFMTDRAVREVEEHCRVISLAPNFLSVSYFNPKDQLCDALGLGFGFKPLISDVMSYYPGHLMIIAKRQISASQFLRNIGGVDYEDYTLLKLSENSKEYTRKVENTGLKSLFGKKYHYEFSSFFAKQKGFVNELLDAKILEADKETSLKAGYIRYQEMPLNTDELLSYFWINDDGRIVPEKYASLLFYNVSAKGQTIKEKVINKSDGLVFLENQRK
ncbi:hypothetical protein [Fulvivirga sediminis]|uniref:Uncharacterized protein n=1 Tax=Fulvivirga sediminis TaxID=2803949 RepID=A0A937JZB7_9BACT|nr:hypothetical protein [Fulvivirga sediminis]MBL3655120.1 hypothetical protein [Fulvivirga sediminis]